MIRRQDIIAIILILVLGFSFVAGTTISIKKMYGEKASNTPVVHATPFPPLNDAKTGKTWPIIDAKPKYIGCIWGIIDLSMIL